MKPKVNETCIGCGSCEAQCPNVFKVAEVNGKMIATVLETDYASAKECIDGAIAGCPVQAISWEE